jgi:hypothetical protein
MLSCLDFPRASVASLIFLTRARIAVISLLGRSLIRNGRIETDFRDFQEISLKIYFPLVHMILIKSYGSEFPTNDLHLNWKSFLPLPSIQKIFT